MRKEQITYTLILHQIRKKLKLTLMEYCVADCVYHLSNNPDSKIQGWCFATKETIAELLGTTERTIFKIIPKVIEKGLMEKNEEDKRYLKSTKKWYENVVLIRLKKEYELSSGSMKKGHKEYEDSSGNTMKKGHTYNNKDKDNYNYKGNLKTFNYPTLEEIEKRK